jgi:hypothetical protein
LVTEDLSVKANNFVGVSSGFSRHGVALDAICLYGRSHHQRPRETPIVTHSKAPRQMKYVQMPAKIARSTPRPLFVLPKVMVAVQT